MVKNVLITGGLGYVGGRMAQHLLEVGYDQITVTSRRDAAPPLPGISLLKVDDTKESYDSYLEGIDVVIHLAAMNEIDCVKHPFQAIEVNVMQTLKWIKAAERASCSQFIYFSTIHVYGSPLIGHIDEAQPTRPTHPYSITHKAAEDYVLASRDRTSLDAIVLRLSNSFGRPLSPNINRWTLLVNDLCKQLIEGGKLHLNSDGSQERDFITLTDVVRSVEHLLSLSKEETSDGLFNLSGEKTQRIYQMAQRITSRSEQVLGIKPPINRPAPSNLLEPTSLFISAAKIKKTGFTFEHPIDQEIDQMLQFCHQHFSRSHD